MRLDNVDPFRLFGLPSDATMPEIRRRYHELALAYHPDRHGGNDRRQARKFAAVCDAYQAILQAREAAERGKAYGACGACGQLKVLIPRLDGTLVCSECLGRSQRIGLLPGPVWVVIKCTFSIVCLIAATTCLVLYCTTESPGYALAACAIGLAGLVVVVLLGFLFPVFPARELRKSQDLSWDRRAQRRRWLGR